MSPCSAERSTLTETAPSEGFLQSLPVRIGEVRQVQLSGAIDAAMDLSGVTVVGDYLVLGADEGHRLQVLLRAPDRDRWNPHPDRCASQEGPGGRY